MGERARETKHTPGPWKVEPYVDAIDIHAADGSLIAHVADRDIASEGMPPENARLIAAAPDLLAACVAFAAWDEGPHATEQEAANVRRLVARAIAKAAGSGVPRA